MNVCILNDMLEHINLRKMRTDPNYTLIFLNCHLILVSLILKYMLIGRWRWIKSLENLNYQKSKK
jgi:hypothetical protein